MLTGQDTGSPQQLLGKKKTYRSSEPIGAKAIRRFASVVGDHNPAYRSTGVEESIGIVAPPTLLFEMGFDLEGDINPKTGSNQDFSNWYGNPKLSQRLSNDYEILRTVRSTDVITAEREIVDVTEKTGRSGPWTFVTTIIVYTNQEGTLLGRQVEKVSCRY